MFDEGFWKCSEVTEKLCFAELHPAEKHGDLDSYRAAFAQYRRIIGPAATGRFDKDHQLGTPPAIFHAYLQALSAGIDSEIRRLFSDVLQIGIAHSARLKDHPAEWAKTHLSILISDERNAVKTWIKSVCDKLDFSKPLNTDEEIEEFIFWKDWRAPKLIYMRPSGNRPYNSSVVWEREDAAVTEKLLEGFSGRFVQSLGFHLGKLLGDAHVELAKAARVVGPIKGTISVGKQDDNGGAGVDRSFELMAVEEALKSIPEDERPHPKVGAVVVKDGKVLSMAHRGEKLKSHAEYVALEDKLSDDLVAGATVYTTLEPCTTRTHPKIACAARLVERKVRRVVIGMFDPNPDIWGKGWQVLRDAGIETAVFNNDLMQQCEEMNREFTRAQRQKQDPMRSKEGTDDAARIAARLLSDATWDLQKAVWSFYALHTRYGVVQAARDIAVEEKLIIEKIDAAFRVFTQDYDVPSDLSATAKNEIEQIHIALANLKVFSMTRQPNDMEIAASQIQDACERIRAAAKRYAYRSTT